MKRHLLLLIRITFRQRIVDRMIVIVYDVKYRLEHASSHDSSLVNDNGNRDSSTCDCLSKIINKYPELI